MRHLAILILVSTALLALAGCGRKVAVIDPNTSIQLSGMWNDDDSRVVGDRLIENCLKGDWITEFRDRTGRAPVIRMSKIQNDTGEPIAIGNITDKLEDALIRSNRVKVVNSRAEAELTRAERSDVQANAGNAPASGHELAPDFILQGAIKVQHDHLGDKKVKYYQIDLKLNDLATTNTVWHGNDSRKKIVED